MRVSEPSRHFFVVAAMAVLGVCLEPCPAFAQSKTGQRWAILIAVNDYIHLKDLEYCVADQKALRDRLVASGFRQDRVFLLADRADDAQYLPIKRNIEQQLNLVLGLVHEGDVVVVGFSGHGKHASGGSYLCPADTELEDPETLVAVNGIMERLSRCPASLKLMIVDACRDVLQPGGAKTTRASDDMRRFADGLKQEPIPEGVLLLTSCAPGEISWEEKEFGHGVFMHFLLQGLKGQADVNGNGGVTLKELADYTRDETDLYAVRRWTRHQRPWLESKGDIRVLDFEIGGLSQPDHLVAPFNKQAAQAAQQAWARHLRADAATTNSIGMKLTLIPAGEFLMGSPDEEEDRSDGETEHRVWIRKPFFLGVYEVTQAEYKRVMGTNPSYFSSAGRGKESVSGLDTSRFPVELVSWDDAAEFCRKLSSLPEERAARRTYRLPTEAEWEYACRAGTTSPFHFGSQLNGEQANSDGGYPYGTTDKGPDLERTTTVGSYAPNAFSLYDMHGNVYEWCQDWYDVQYYATSPSADPKGPSSGSSRVLRGGSWGSSAWYCRSAARVRYAAGGRYDDDGFRLLCEFE